MSLQPKLSRVWSACSLDLRSQPQTQPFIEIGPDACGRIKDYPLAVSKVRYQGEPVVAVVAESPSLGR